MPTSAPPPPEFLVTKEYRRFVELCAACRRDRYIGLCAGAPGVGKTLSARHYAQWDLVEALRSAVAPHPPRPPAQEGPGAVDGACRTVFYTPPVANTPRAIERHLSELWLGSIRVATRLAVVRGAPGGAGPDDDYLLPELILVDEADRLRLTGPEQVRDVYDRRGVGLILIGLPGLETRLARYPQLYSRVGFLHHFRALDPEELRFLLTHKWAQLGLTLAPDDFTDAEAVATIARITGGNFRLVQRLFAQIERVLRINQLRTVSKEVVEAARESLVLGPV